MVGRLEAEGGGGFWARRHGMCLVSVALVTVGAAWRLLLAASAWRSRYDEWTGHA